MPVLNNILAGAAGQSGGAGDFKIERSLRFDQTATAHLNRTPPTSGAKGKWTWSGWVKRCTNGNNDGLFEAEANGNYTLLRIRGDNDRISLDQYGGDNFYVYTDAVFRDNSAWYHIVCVVDTTQSTDSNRVKIYVNGVQQTLTAGTNWPSQNQDTRFNDSSYAMRVGGVNGGTQFDGYMAEVHFLDGIAVSNPDGVFGEFDADTGVWNPIKYTGEHNAPATGSNPTSTSNVAPSGGYGNTIPSAALLFSIGGPTNATSHIRQDGGGIEWSPAITLSGSDVAGVSCSYFNNASASFDVEFKIDGSWVTAQSAAQNVIGTNTSGVLITHTTTGSWTGVRVTGGSNVSVSGILGIYKNGTRLHNGGVNGFFLDFSNSSSSASLGFDANVSGTRYSSMMSGNANTNYPFTRIFDGNTSTLSLGQNGQTFTFTPTPALSYAAASGGVEIYFPAASQPDKVRINGGSWVNQTNGSTGGWQTVSTGDGTLNSIEFSDQSSNEAAIAAIRVNGTILTDPVGANDWAVNNFTAVVPTPPFSWDGGTLNLSATGGVGNAGGYKDAYFLLPSTGSHSWDMVINTDGNTGFWFSDSTSASNTHPDQQSGNFVGLRNNGNGNAATGGSGFGSGTVSMPSDWMDGDPRWYFTIDRANGSGTVKAGPSGTSYSFTIPTTGNVYFHVNAYGTYEFDLSNGSPTDIDTLFDSPTNYDDGTNIGGNYATWNPLFGENRALSDGNLNAMAAASGYAIIASTLAMTSGKWYMEYHYTSNANSNGDGGNYVTFGISQTNRDGTEGSGVTDTSEDFGFKCHSGGFSSQTNGQTQHNYSNSVSTGDILSLAFDADAGKLWVAKNGTWMTNSNGTGDPTNGNNPDFSNLNYSGGYFFMAGPYKSDNLSSQLEANFGARSFKYTPPTNFKRLCTQNFDDPLIEKGSKYLGILTWDGAGGTGDRTISGLALENAPDFIWSKTRNHGYHHALFDSVRGFGSNNALNTDANHTEGQANGGNIKSTTSSSITFEAGSSSGVWYNESNKNYIAWCWDAGTSNTTVAVDANGSGLPGAACEYRANTTAGFSIVKVANPTSTDTRVHGLGKKPDLIICKSTASADSWHTYHSSLGYQKYININGTSGATTSDQFGSQEPTSTYFYVKSNTGSGANKSGGMVYYIWTAVENYSAFGSYEGNGSSDGAFVYTGFRPAWILVKNADGTGHWVIMDSKRDVDNQMEDRLKADAADAESNTPAWDALSNGFKIRSTYGFTNTNGNTYIYAAFAENPFKYARAR